MATPWSGFRPCPSPRFFTPLLYFLLSFHSLYLPPNSDRWSWCTYMYIYIIFWLPSFLLDLCGRTLRRSVPLLSPSSRRVAETNGTMDRVTGCSLLALDCRPDQFTPQKFVCWCDWLYPPLISLGAGTVLSFDLPQCYVRWLKMLTWVGSLVLVLVMMIFIPFPLRGQFILP